MVLQTFLLLDLWSKDNDLGGVTLISIKSAPKIYYIQMMIPDALELLNKKGVRGMFVLLFQTSNTSYVR